MAVKIEYNSAGLPMYEFDRGDGVKVWRVMGVLPPKEFCGLPDFPSARNLLKAAQPVERDYRPLIDEILDQGETNACGPHAYIGTFRAHHLACGRTPYRFDPWFSYATANHGQDAGVYLSELLQGGIKFGTGLRDDNPRKAMYWAQISQQQQQNALRFRVGQAYRITSAYDDIVAAVSAGFLAVVGITVGRNFGNLDKYGVAPLPDVVIGGHALGIVGTVLLPTGEWGLITLNSWGARWGINGYCILTRKHFAQNIDAFALQTALWDPLEQGPPVVSHLVGVPPESAFFRNHMPILDAHGNYLVRPPKTTLFAPIHPGDDHMAKKARKAPAAKRKPAIKPAAKAKPKPAPASKPAPKRKPKPKAQRHGVRAQVPASSGASTTVPQGKVVTHVPAPTTTTPTTKTGKTTPKSTPAATPATVPATNRVTTHKTNTPTTPTTPTGKSRAAKTSG